MDGLYDNLKCYLYQLLLVSLDVILDNSVFVKFVSRSILLTCLSIFLSACSSNPESQNSAAKSRTQQDRPTSTNNSEARQQGTQSSYTSVQEQQINQAYSALLQGLPEQQIAQLIYQISPEQFYSIDADLKLAKIYLHLGQIDSANILVDRLKRGALPARYQIPLWLVSAQLDAHKGEHLNSIRTLFRLSQLYGVHLSRTDKKLNNELIWQNLLKLSAPSLEVFKSDFGEEADSWIQLAELLHNFPNNPSRFSQQIQYWANAHSAYALSDSLPKQISDLAQVEAFEPKNVALILPFTGRLAKRSNAIRDGFFAGINFNSDTKYTLLDSTKLTIEEVEQAILEKGIDFIVGPLQKETVTQYQQSEVISAVNQLNLNSVEELPQGQSNHYYFGLAPEDEIAQAVDYFVAKGVEHPAIIYADNSLGRRLFDRFNGLWQAETNNEVESIAFQNQSKLDKAVKELLDVGLSEQRIKQIEKLFGARIKSEERSRNDIDAIYVIANSQQTRLIKPFFDVNVSNFGKALPIYASSRSYLIGETNSEKLDLNGLTFTEIPWLLSEQNDQLSQLYTEVGENNTQLKKMFAFGYDANHLIPVLQHLAILPEVAIPALNGQLSIGSSNRINRQLQWAQYKQGKVIVIKTINQ